MVRKSPAQLDRDIAEALSRTPSSTAHATIDTTETLDRKFRSRQLDALTLSEKARQARGAAARWMKRSGAYARAGEFREADEAQTEAIALGQMAARLEAEVAQLRTRSHATMKRASRHDGDRTAHLFVEGVGHRLPHGYEIHWNWVAYRDGKKIDAGALSGGDLPEFYETWPDYDGLTPILKKMKSLMRAWVLSGEFGVRDLSPNARVSIRKSSSEVPIRGR